jgi:gamma-tubulin complex component 4
MFLIDNLQYYLQVDVLESQFSIMMDKIKETKDFEQILRAHSCFQANVLSLCFLLDQSEPLSKTINNSMMENPVLAILNKILNLIEQFTAFAYIASSPMTNEDKVTLDNFDELFSSFVDSLLKLLSGLCSAPLAQLLLRLDFNYWFSTKNLKQY